MNQQKIGNFLKELRKEKGLTQEQLAEKFNVTGRSVSRWENGVNMPDLSILIEIADFYDVDIKEMIDGERKSETMHVEEKETLQKVAEYTDFEREQIIIKMKRNSIIALVALLFVYATSIGEDVPSYYIIIRVFCFILTFCSVGESILYSIGKMKAAGKNGNLLTGRFIWPIVIATTLVLIICAVAMISMI